MHTDRAEAENAEVSEAIMRTVDAGTIAITILEFSQDGQWLHRALLESHELEHIRQHPLTSGAKEFVQPCELFGVVVQ